MNNPYSPPAITSRSIIDERARRSRYFFKHFSSFNLSFIASLLLFYCIFAGPTETFASLISESSVWLFQFGIGLLAWGAHATLALLWGLVRKSGPILNGAVGGAGFVACILLSQIVQDFAPNSMSVPWSWTPAYARLGIFTTGSIAMVALITAIYRYPKDDADNHGLNGSDGSGGL